MNFFVRCKIEFEPQYFLIMILWFFKDRNQCNYDKNTKHTIEKQFKKLGQKILQQRNNTLSYK